MPKTKTKTKTKTTHFTKHSCCIEKTITGYSVNAAKLLQKSIEFIFINVFYREPNIEISGGKTKQKKALQRAAEN